MTMKIFFRLFYFSIILFIVLMLPVLSVAQQQDTVSLPKYVNIHADYAISDISDGKPCLLVGTEYTHPLSTLFAIGIGLQAVQRTYSFSELSNTLDFSAAIPRFIPQFVEYSRMAYAITGSVSLEYIPIEHHQFRIGVGILLRRSGLLRSQIITELDNLSQSIEIIDTQQTALGGQLYCEYGIPIDNRLNIGFNLTSQVFLPPMLITGNREPLGRLFSATSKSFYGGLIAVGGFIRIGF